MASQIIFDVHMPSVAQVVPRRHRSIKSLPVVYKVPVLVSSVSDREAPIVYGARGDGNYRLRSHGGRLWRAYSCSLGPRRQRSGVGADVLRWLLNGSLKRPENEIDLPSTADGFSPENYARIVDTGLAEAEAKAQALVDRFLIVDEAVHVAVSAPMRFLALDTEKTPAVLSSGITDGRRSHIGIYFGLLDDGFGEVGGRAARLYEAEPPASPSVAEMDDPAPFSLDPEATLRADLVAMSGRIAGQAGFALLGSQSLRDWAKVLSAIEAKEKPVGVLEALAGFIAGACASGRSDIPHYHILRLRDGAMLACIQAGRLGDPAEAGAVLERLMGLAIEEAA